MKPQEVTELLGIDRDRIKYFKKQDIFTPEIPPKTNRGTEYTERDVEMLKKIVVLTKAGLTCGDIKKIQEGKYTLEQALRERQTAIRNEMERMQGSLALADEIIHENREYESIPADYYLDEIHRRERAGEVFIDFMDYQDLRAGILMRPIICPCCGHKADVDLEDYLLDETSNESHSDNDMGADIVYSIDSGDEYECPSCARQLKISGWLREYPVGAYDSDDIAIEMVE